MVVRFSQEGFIVYTEKQLDTFLSCVKTLLDESANRLDESIVSRLRKSREKAIKESRKHGSVPVSVLERFKVRREIPRDENKKE